MACNFVSCDREQAYLLPPSLREWLPERDLAWFVVDAVGQMNLSSLYAKYRTDGWGAAAFGPKMMTTLLLYAYCVGERSSRRIERLCERDIEGISAAARAYSREFERAGSDGAEVASATADPLRRRRSAGGRCTSCAE